MEAMKCVAFTETFSLGSEDDSKEAMSCEKSHESTISKIKTLENKENEVLNESAGTESDMQYTGQINEKGLQEKVVWLSAFTIKMNRVHAELLGKPVLELRYASSVNQAYHMGRALNVRRFALPAVLWDQGHEWVGMCSQCGQLGHEAPDCYLRFRDTA